MTLSAFSDQLNTRPAPEALAFLAQQAELRRASDIHLQSGTNGLHISFRVDGLLVDVAVLDNDLGGRLLGRVKYLSRLKTYQNSFPQDGRIEKAEIGTQNDLRVSTYPTVSGEKITLRFFRPEAGLTLEELFAFLPATINALRHAIAQPSGLILLTGPAGSGKTTTIYACLRELVSNGRAAGRHVVTIEDPVEQIIPGVMQTEINDARGLTFSKAMRHLMRQDPQVLVVGEIRDDETAKLAVRAAFTGHLLIATLHAGSCRGVYERLLLLTDDSFAVSSSVTLVLNQRLLRAVCESCAGRGCETCLSTGYSGRIAVAEQVSFDAQRRERLRNEGPSSVASSPTLVEVGNDLVKKGRTTEAEVQRVCGTL